VTSASLVDAWVAESLGLLESTLDDELAAGRPVHQAMIKAAYRASTFVLTMSHRERSVAVSNDAVVARVAAEYGRDDPAAPDADEAPWHAAARVIATRRALLAAGACETDADADTVARMAPWGDDKLAEALTPTT
jgi:hypothetical protein